MCDPLCSSIIGVLCRSEEFLDLPLVGVQTLLASDDITVRDEITAFHAMMEWLRHHYEDMEEKR